MKYSKNIDGTFICAVVKKIAFSLKSNRFLFILITSKLIQRIERDMLKISNIRRSHEGKASVLIAESKLGERGLSETTDKYLIGGGRLI